VGYLLQHMLRGTLQHQHISITDDVNWTRGKHQVAFGGEWVHTELNVSNIYEGNGNFAFSGIFAGEGPAQSIVSTAREGNLDFLTGSLATFGQEQSPAKCATRADSQPLCFRTPITPPTGWC